MNLLIYSHFFAPSVGGVESVVLSLASGLADLREADDVARFKIILVTQTPRGNFDDLALPFPIVRQPGVLHLWQLIRKSDVIHIAGPALTPLIFGLISRKPVTVEHHGFQTICPNGQLLIEPTNDPCPGHFMAGHHTECFRCNSGQGWIASRKLWFFTFVRRFLCARAAANITPTQWLGGLLHLPRIVTISHGIADKEVETPFTPPNGTPVIAFQGRLVTTKGARLLLEAAQILHGQKRAFKLLVIGDGPVRASLERFTRQSQLTPYVNFTGCLGESQLETALSKASIVVVPSLGGEVFGLVLAENMLRAVPIVASNLGAFVEVLCNSGIVFRTGDAVELATALARLLDDPALARELGQRARQRALALYNMSRMIEAHAAIYYSLCSLS